MIITITFSSIIVFHLYQVSSILFHNESTFQANDYECTQWGTKDDHMLMPKSKGAGIISDFICEQDGYLKLTDAEFTAGTVKFPLLKQNTRTSIEYGENKDGYWMSEKFMDQLKYCACLLS